MQIILKKDHHPLGQKGQSVSVKPGYFRNFLLPQGLAQAGTKKLLARAEEINKKIAEQKMLLKKEAEKLRDTLRDTTLHLKEKLNKKGTLFAKVSAKEIAEALESQAKIKISASSIILKEAIKQTGNFEVDVKLQSGVIAKVRVTVEGIEETK